MHRVRRHSAFLLVAFVVGGFVAPSVHQAWHAEEWAQERAAHLADGHHHPGRHAPTAAAPCAKPVVVDLQCVLCHGVSVFLPTAPSAVLAPAPQGWLREALRARAVEATAGHRSIRGPPEQVA